ncbi:MAG: DMT family transporter [Metallibacterium scheffleri]|jgi:drug/metabolite transporter (DMT)-like permease|uniref:EamA family transporter n=1 Tax=Metallibacterium scheffleri TaxID=993689 RepID=UPI0026ED2802|nr:DMT family transporter [Metallibacterium scheffleri]MCK9367119.1 DMT family transporter [Metallibacterium scheffleri]
MSPAAKARLQIHFCVFLWGFTAILGKLITLAALPLVWWRMLLVSGTLLLVPRVWRALRVLPLRLALAYAGIGVIVSLHWLTFYGAIKLANASVAATCIAVAPLFLAFLEPLLARRRFELRELLLALVVVPGVALVVDGVPADMRVGVGVGVLSALLVATFSALNKRLVAHADPLAVTALELGAGAAFLTMLAPLLPHSGSAWPLPDAHDALLLLILAYACTLLPFALSLHALRQVSAFSMQLITNLEPVYAIILAIVLLHEQRVLDARFYLGVLVILGAVFLHPLLARGRRHAAQPELLATAESKNLVD